MVLIVMVIIMTRKIRVCDQCGETFYGSRDRRKQVHYFCSRKCYNLYLSNLKEKGIPDPMRQWKSEQLTHLEKLAELRQWRDLWNLVMG